MLQSYTGLLCISDLTPKKLYNHLQIQYKYPHETYKIYSHVNTKDSVNNSVLIQSGQYTSALHTDTQYTQWRTALLLNCAQWAVRGASAQGVCVRAGAGVTEWGVTHRAVGVGDVIWANSWFTGGYCLDVCGLLFYVSIFDFGFCYNFGNRS